MTDFDVLFATQESRLQLAERLNFVKTARSVFGVAGARRAWATVGLPAILDELQSNSAVAEFLAKCTERDATARVQASTLYDRYRAWLPATELLLGVKAFARVVEHHGHARVKASSMFFVGLRIKDAADVR